MHNIRKLKKTFFTFLSSALVCNASATHGEGRRQTEDTDEDERCVEKECGVALTDLRCFDWQLSKLKIAKYRDAKERQREKRMISHLIINVLRKRDHTLFTSSISNIRAHIGLSVLNAS